MDESGGRPAIQRGDSPTPSVAAPGQSEIDCIYKGHVDV
jgi:hypothetical protein